MNALELAQEHLEITVTTDANNKREWSSMIAQAAANVAVAEAQGRLAAALEANSDLLVTLVQELRVAPGAGGSAAEKIRAQLQAPTKAELARAAKPTVVDPDTGAIG